MIFIDTNVLVDVLAFDPIWKEWSRLQLAQHALYEKLSINPVVYAELSPPYPGNIVLDEILARLHIKVEAMNSRSLFLAGKAHHAYRNNRGKQLRTLPDFLIGAQALVANGTLLTRDARRYKTYFPTLKIIEPTTQ